MTNEHEYFPITQSPAGSAPLAWVGHCTACASVPSPEYTPLAGFIAKLLPVSIAFEAGFVSVPLRTSQWSVVILIYYYFGWIREIPLFTRDSWFSTMTNLRKDPWVSNYSETGLIKVVLVTLTVVLVDFGNLARSTRRYLLTLFQQTQATTNFSIIRTYAAGGVKIVDAPRFSDLASHAEVRGSDPSSGTILLKPLILCGALSLSSSFSFRQCLIKAW